MVSSAVAWNKAGHMVSGAIAYADLKQANPETLARVIALLKTHPHFETKWAPRLVQLPLSPEEQDLYLFMLAARWPDDIRGDPTFHHGAWHYINLPYKPEGQPASVQTVDPPPDNILQAYQTNLDILRIPAPASIKAVALCGSSISSGMCINRCIPLPSSPPSFLLLRGTVVAPASLSGYERERARSVSIRFGMT
jgi:S1/P1 Nuclease